MGNKTITLNLSLEKKFSISGRVTYPDGTPAANWTVMATWPSPDSKAEYDDFAMTDAEGRYTLGAPYEVASYVGCSGKQVHRGVKAGRSDVDFVAPKPKKPPPATQPDKAQP